MNIRSYILPFWNLWPPFLFSGIKVIKRSKDMRHIAVKLKLRFWNANFVGTQYGGLIFSMADPFYMVMLIQNLGPSYSIWDKTSTIRFLKPGKTDLFASFDLQESDLALIRKEVDEQSKIEWIRKIEIRDTQGEIVAEVEKTISIKKKTLYPSGFKIWF